MASLGFNLLQHLASGFRRAVLLFAAGGLVGEGHFEEVSGEQRLENLVPELGPIGARNEQH